MSNVSQVHRYELRKARAVAFELATQALVVYQGYIKPPYLAELSVKESSAVEWQNESGKTEARTTFTFRYEGGTVVRVLMKGHDDYSFGFQWSEEAAFLTLYMDTVPKFDAIKEHLWLESWRSIRDFLNCGHRKDARKTQEHYLRRNRSLNWIKKWQRDPSNKTIVTEVPAFEWEESEIFDFVYDYEVDRFGKWTPYLSSVKVLIPQGYVFGDGDEDEEE